jgi:hypothetical protein
MNRQDVERAVKKSIIVERDVAIPGLLSWLSCNCFLLITKEVKDDPPT